MKAFFTVLAVLGVVAGSAQADQATTPTVNNGARVDATTGVPVPTLPTPGMASQATCSHDGSTYQQGAKLCIAGKINECTVQGDWSATDASCR